MIFKSYQSILLAALSIWVTGGSLADVSPTTAPATQPAATNIPESVGTLIEKLADPVWREREKAEKALVAMGNAIVPALRTALEGDLNDEARHRIESAIVKIDEQDESGASTINIEAVDMPAKEFFAELSRQVRAELLPAQPELWEMGNFNNKATLSLQNATFWQTMKVVQEKYNLDLVPWNDGVRLVPGGNGNGMMRGPSVVSGPFMVVAQQVYRSQTADLNNGGGMQSEFLVRFTGFCEPKLRLMQAAAEMQIEEAIDDNGNVLIGAAANRHSGFAGSNNGMWNFNAHLRYPEANPGKRIVRLKGVVPVILQTGYETLEVEDPLNKKNIQKTLGNVFIDIRELTRNGDRYTLRLAATVAQDNYQRIQSLIYNAGNGGDIRLLDETGAKFSPTSRNVTQNNNTFEATIDFIPEPSRRNRQKASPGVPTKLVVKVPTATKNVSIPLEFRDIPIP